MDTKPSVALEEAGSTSEPALYPGLPGGARAISGAAWYVDDAGVRTVSVGQTVLTSYALEDKLGRDYALAQLSRCKYATQQEVATAFGVSRCTVSRICGRLDAAGIGGLVRKPRCDKTPGAVAAKVCRLRREGKRIREVSARTRVSRRTVRTILSAQGVSASDRPVARQLTLGEGENDRPAAGEAAPEEPALECPVASSPEPLADDAGEETEASTGSAPEVMGGALSGGGLSAEEIHGLERALAPTGWVEEATVIFESAEKVRGAGALLAVAVAGGTLLETARSAYGKLRNGFYGLRCTVLGLLAMSCLEVKNSESLKGEDPVELGRLLGLDRVFEVKTLRRKLRELGRLGKAAAWHRLVSQRWVAEDKDRVATLYVDGHTRAYYGKRKVAKGWVARRRLCQPATSDTWVNDRRGAPVLRVTEEAHPALCKVLPEIVKDVRELIGDGARPTVVFDRGGWSGTTFRQLVAAGFDFATYQKGTFEPLPERAFQVYRVESEGTRGARAKNTEYRLTEDRVTLAGYGEARRDIELCESGKQLPVVTNKEAPAAVEVVQEARGRWAQENCFKYLREHYNLDALVDYGYEPAPDRELPNPARKSLNKELQAARKELQKLQSAYGQSRHDAKERRQLTAALAKQEQGVLALTQQRDALPTRVQLSASDRTDEVRLSLERKLFTDVVKMAAYRADCTLVEWTTAHFARNAEEGHAFVRAALRQPADLRVSDDLVEVLFEPLSAPRFTRALTGLCAAVNATHPTFPETRYRLLFSVKDPDQM